MATLSGFEGLAAHFARVLAHIEAARREVLQECGTLIQVTAQGKLGTYQAGAGPFAAWAPLTDATRADRVSKGYSEDEPLLRTGALRAAVTVVLAGTDAHIGVPNQSVGAGTPRDLVRNIGDVAEWMELGTNRVPPRSFLGSSLFEQMKACQHIANVRFARLIHTGA